MLLGGMSLNGRVCRYIFMLVIGMYVGLQTTGKLGRPGYS